ncbi:MAG: pilus assembly protein TadG-related protein [Pseudomonadota bacterium]
MNILKDVRGGTAILWATALLPLLVCAGAALDFSRNRAMSVEIQAATDHTALAVARFALNNEDASDADIDQFAQRHFDTNDIEMSGYTIGNIQVQRSGDRFDLTVEGVGPTTMLGVAGITELPVFAEAAAEVSPNQSPLEIALVLDTSASMQGSKITTLRSSASDMINELVEEDGNVQMGIVPFNLAVNIGESNRGASWLDVNDERTVDENICVTDADASIAAGCSFNSCGGRNAETGNCFGTWSCPSGVSRVTNCSSEPRTYSWEGCVRSRTPPYNVDDGGFGANPVLSWSLIDNDNCPNGNRIRPLSDDPSELVNAINQLDATWPTYIPAGLTWGRRVLSQAEPFTESVFDGDSDTTMAGGRSAQAIVLMSDGANTGSLQSSGTHWGGDVSATNQLTSDLCEAIKDDGTEMFVVAFEVTDAPTIDLLEDCASSEGHFYEANSELQLSASFAGIAGEFSRRRELALVR